MRWGSWKCTLCGEEPEAESEGGGRVLLIQVAGGWGFPQAFGSAHSDGGMWGSLVRSQVRPLPSSSTVKGTVENWVHES